MHELALTLEAHPTLAAWTQTLVLAITAGLVIWYAWETRRMAKAAKDATRDNAEMLVKLEALVDTNGQLAAASTAMAAETASLAEATRREVHALEAPFLPRVCVGIGYVHFTVSSLEGAFSVSHTNRGPGVARRAAAWVWLDWGRGAVLPPPTTQDIGDILPHDELWSGPYQPRDVRRQEHTERGVSMPDIGSIASVRRLCVAALVTWSDDLGRCWGTIGESEYDVACLMKKAAAGEDEVAEMELHRTCERAWPREPERMRRLSPDDALWPPQIWATEHQDIYAEVQRLVTEEGVEVHEGG